MKKREAFGGLEINTDENTRGFLVRRYRWSCVPSRHCPLRGRFLLENENPQKALAPLKSCFNSGQWGIQTGSVQNSLLRSVIAFCAGLQTAFRGVSFKETL